LKAQIAKLSAKIDRIGKQSAKKAEKVAEDGSQQARNASSEDFVKRGAFPGSISIPGTSTSVKIGGYIKVDAIEDIGTGYGAPWAAFRNVPLEGTQQAGQNAQTTFGAQQSRINFETRTASSIGEIRTFIEADFYGSAAANSNTSGYGLQLRHAYGSVGAAASGQLLAGQTWSNFMDVSAMPETIDYIGPAGTVFVRQPQVRYTRGFGDVTLSGSVEIPADINQGTTNMVYVSSALSGTGTVSTIAPRTVMPDLILAAKYDYAKNGYTSLRAVFNQTNIDRTGGGASNETETGYGFGVVLSGKQGLFEKDAINYSFTSGRGVGRYVYDISAGGSYYNATTQDLKQQWFYAGTLGYQHKWNNYFRSNVFGGLTRIFNNTDNMVTGVENASTTNKMIASSHFNLIWQPAPAYQIGVEYMHGYRETQSGTEGALDRLQASFAYNF